jgi:hypothetical protein
MTSSAGGAQRHFVDVWNPSIAADAMTAHLTVLLDAAKRMRGTDEAPHVWWGKVRSRNRRQDLPHLTTIREIAAELERDTEHERECRLYLTDYRSLYVGLVGAIVEEDVRATDADHVPAYYTARQLECDFWYQLLDIRRVVADDTTVVIAKLKSLLNLGYGERPVSLYGGMVDLPLVVYDPEDERLFDLDERAGVAGDLLWVEVDAEAVGVGRMERELRENLLGDEAWLRLDPAARTFIASAETIFRQQRSDPAFDFSPVVTNLSKALEVTCSAILRRIGPSIPRELRMVRIDTKTIDLSTGGHLSTGQLAGVLRGKTALHKFLRQRLENGGWFVDAFPDVLGRVAAVRNPGAHRSRIDQDTAVRLRNELMGVGGRGVFVELTRVHAP